MGDPLVDDNVGGLLVRQLGVLVLGLQSFLDALVHAVGRVGRDAKQVSEQEVWRVVLVAHEHEDQSVGEPDLRRAASLLVHSRLACVVNGERKN